MVDKRSSVEKVVKAHQCGKSRHSGASAWKRESQCSSVEKEDIAQQL